MTATAGIALPPLRLFLALTCLLELATMVTTYSHHHQHSGDDEAKRRPCLGENCPGDECLLSVEVAPSADCPAPVAELAANASYEQVRAAFCLKGEQKLEWAATSLEKDLADATTKLDAALATNEHLEKSLARQREDNRVQCLQIEVLEDRAKRLRDENIGLQQKEKELLDERSAVLVINSRLRHEDGRLRERLAAYEKNCSSLGRGGNASSPADSRFVDIDRPQSTAVEDPEIYIGRFDLPPVVVASSSEESSSSDEKSAGKAELDLEKQREIDGLKKDLNSILFAKLQQEKTIALLRAMLRQRARF